MNGSCVRAFPGLPVVFAEGFRVVDGRRISRHASVGAALTDDKEGVRTETVVSNSDSETVLFVDGKKIQDSRGMGMLRMIEKMKERAWFSGNLAVESRNYGILSGSSDSGAAALAVALDDFLEVELSWKELLSFSLYGSETSYRSLFGGLTEYRVMGGEVSAEVIASPEDLSGAVVYGVTFPVERFSADELHGAVVGHPQYVLREKRVEEAIRQLKGCLADDDLLGVFSVMEEDACAVHRMFTGVGKRVIKPEMKKLCDAVEGWRSQGLEVFWSVAGGSQVYVFCLKDEKEVVASRIEEGGWTGNELKFAGGVVVKKA